MLKKKKKKKNKLSHQIVSYRSHITVTLPHLVDSFPSIPHALDAPPGPFRSLISPTRQTKANYNENFFFFFQNNWKDCFRPFASKVLRICKKFGESIILYWQDKNTLALEMRLWMYYQNLCLSSCFAFCFCQTHKESHAHMVVSFSCSRLWARRTLLADAKLRRWVHEFNLHKTTNFPT